MGFMIGLGLIALLGVVWSLARASSQAESAHIEVERVPPQPVENWNWPER